MDSTRLVQIRKDFYLSIKRRVESVLGQESREISADRNRYEAELSRLSWRAVDKRHFFSRLKTAEVVIVGDFHAQKQSTRGFLRILRKLKSPYVIALECLRVKDQVSIDRYLNAEITEKEFLNQVAWKSNWGFPWDNYKPLFKWAQTNRIKIFGINSHQPGKSLREREAFSAAVLKKIKSAHKASQVFVQYGDLHLASAHLPKAIQKAIPKVDLCTVYQSPEVLYFKIMEQQKELSTDVVKFNENQWALNVLSPWIKWQDYLLFLESGYDKKVKNVDVDPTDTVAQTVQYLAHVFGLQVDLGGLSVYISEDDAFFDLIEKAPALLRARLVEKVQEGSSFYCPELQCGYLARYSVNHVVRVAAEYIYCKEGAYRRTLLDPKKDFLKCIWLEAVIYFFSKVKNPKRKTDTMQDIRAALQKEQFDDRGKEALMLALTQKLREMQFLAEGRLRQHPHFDMNGIKQARKSFSIAAQIVGGIAGEKIFYAFSKKMLQMPAGKKLIFRDLQSASFTKIYYESLELIESWPVAFKSKYDRL